jgi:hypothetical protein
MLSLPFINTIEALYPGVMSDENNNTKPATSKDVAQWMLSAVLERGELTQNNAFYEINKQFGSGFTTITNAGSPSIKGGVLTAFKNISEDTIVWERGNKLWRKREFYDAPGREQP